MENVSCVGEGGRVPHLNQLKYYKSIFEFCTKPPNSNVIGGRIREHLTRLTHVSQINLLCVRPFNRYINKN